MKSFDRKISNLVLDLDGNRSKEDASRITEVELIRREVKDEFIAHKMQIYETFPNYVKRDVPEEMRY